MDEAIEKYLDIEIEYGYKEEEFSSLNTDEQKFEYAFKHFNVFSFDKLKSKNAKSLRTGEQLKNLGNDAFKTGDYKRALQNYTKSIIFLPQSTKVEREVFAISLANRSAALYHLHEYKLALVDINLAVDYGYPGNLMYKVLDRKARCLLALNKFRGAQQAFRKMLQSLSEAELPNKRRKELMQNVQEELAKLNKIQNINDENESQKDEPVVAGGKHSKYKAISSSVEIVHTDMSEYAVASRNIEPGEILSIEEAHSAVAFPDSSKMLCFHCLKKAIAPQPCPDCCQIVFCSISCLNKALLTHHKYECRILSVLWKSRILKWFLALRMITQQRLQYFLDLRQTLKESRKIIHSRSYTNDDYRTVYSLRSKKPIQYRDFLRMAIYSVCYLRLLQDAKYFTPSEHVSTERKLSDEENYIGGLILHNIIVTTFNECLISYVITDICNAQIGTGIFPTNICFGHSCVPSVFGYYNGSTLVSQAICCIKKGDKITVNFNLPCNGREYIFGTPVPREIQLLRREACKCVPCKHQWPNMLEMCNPLYRLSQQFYRCNCGNVVSGFDFIWCSQCVKKIDMKRYGLHQQEIVKLCEKSEEYRGINLSEALKTSLNAILLLKRAPVELYVYYKCLQTAMCCLNYYGNMMTVEEFAELGRDLFY